MADRDLGPLLFDADAPVLSHVIGALHAMGLIAALVLNLGGLVLVFSNRQFLKATAVQLLLLPMVNEVFRCASVLVAMFVMCYSSNRARRNAYCQFEGFAILMGYAMFLLSLANIAVDRYCVVRGRRYSLKHMAASFLVGIGTTAPVSLVYVFMDRGYNYVLSPSRVYCIAPWASRDRRLRNLNAVAATVAAACVAVTLHCQMVVFRAHRDAKRGLESAQALAPKAAAASAARAAQQHRQAHLQQQRNQHILMWRFFGMSLMTVAAWTPMFAEILYSIASGTDVPPAVDGIASMLTTLVAVPITLLHLFFTPQIRKEIRRIADKVRGTQAHAQAQAGSQSQQLSQTLPDRASDAALATAKRNTTTTSALNSRRVSYAYDPTQSSGQL